MRAVMTLPRGLRLPRLPKIRVNRWAVIAFAVIVVLIGGSALAYMKFQKQLQAANPLNPPNPYPPTTFHALNVAMPNQIGSYTVAPEPDATKLLSQGGADSMLEGGEVFTFRTGKLLQATLEVGELTPDAKIGDQTFEAGVVGQIGSTIMRPVNLGKQRVWEGSGNRDLVYVWFKPKGRLMYVLLTHDVQDPVALLQSVLSAAP